MGKVKGATSRFAWEFIKLPNFQRVAVYAFWPQLSVYWRRYSVGFLALIQVDLINALLPLTVRAAIDALPAKNFHRLVEAGVIYFGLMAFQAIGRYLWRVYLIGTSHLIARRLRIDLYDHLQGLPLEYYQRVRTGDLMSRATNDIESVRQAVGPGVLVTADALFTFLFMIPVMIYLSPKLALLAFAFYPLVPWLTKRLGERIDQLYELLQAKMSQMGAYAQESFGAIRLIKSLVQESRVCRRFGELSQDYESDGIRMAKYQAVFSPSLGLLTNLGTFLILLVGGRDVMRGALSVGTFVAFQRYVVQLSWPMEAIGWAVTLNQEGLAAFRRLNDVRTAPQVVSVRKEAASSLPTGGPLLALSGLKYGYAGEGSFSLALEDLALQSGQKIGLVGPVGSGKTTLFNLLLRLYEPAPGTIRLGGRDVLGIPLTELRRRMASVEQSVFLFNEPLEVNLKLGFEADVSEADLRSVTSTAHVLEEIEEMDLGFGTILGERGVSLSGGQKQRVALARALIRHPEVLLLDDAFSAVDVAIENRIIESFFSQYPDLSLLFASHRLSVMPRMDEIWLLNGGRLVGRGSHAELLRGHPLYQALWQKSERQVEREMLDLKTEEAETGGVA